MRKRRQAIIVLGMHRSGTSALTRVASLLGGVAPRHTLAANPANEKGYWESGVLVGINDEILASAGLSWSDWKPFPDAWYASPVATEARSRLAEAVTAEFGSARSFVLKDPRMCRLMPLWLDVLAELEIEPRILLSVRHPLEVVESLGKRDGLSTQHALSLWLRYNLDAERGSRGQPRGVVRYDRLIEDWRDEVAQAGAVAGIPWPRLGSGVDREVDEFLVDDLRHHKAGAKAARKLASLSPWAADLYGALLDLQADPARRDLCERVDAVRLAFDEADRLFGRELGRVRADLEAEKTAKSEAERTLSAELESLRAALRDVEATSAEQRREAEARIAEAQAERERQVEARLVNSAAALADAEERAGRAAEALAEAEERAARSAAALSELQARAERSATALAVAEDQHRAATAREAAVRFRLAEVERDLAVARAENGRVSEVNAALTRSLADIGAAMGQNQAALASLEQRLGQMQAEARAAEALPTLKAERDEAREKAAAAELAITRLHRDLAQRSSSIAVLEAEVAALRAEVAAALDRSARLEQESRATARVVDTDRTALGELHEEVATLGQQALQISAAAQKRAAEQAALREQLRNAGKTYGSIFGLLGGKLRADLFGKRAPRAEPPAKPRVSETSVALVGASPLFDAAYYLTRNPDVAKAGWDPARHYLVHGWREGRDPHPLFATRWYLAANPDVASSDRNPLIHFLRVGGREFRDPNPLFSSGDYAARKGMARDGGEIPVLHYLAARPGAEPEILALFDEPAYVALCPAAAHDRHGALGHYLRVGRASGVAVTLSPEAEDRLRAAAGPVPISD
ncbi:hypothetical protein [Prosthecomicrobium sp. N25]|uniref:hypothetical protein n=1 Tax=Prosthecomicrobium sp. N25 TaxID=3129254 RepID=UPI003076F335